MFSSLEIELDDHLIDIINNTAFQYGVSVDHIITCAVWSMMYRDLEIKYDNLVASLEGEKQNDQNSEEADS